MKTKVLIGLCLWLALFFSWAWPADNKQPTADQEQKTAPVEKPASPLADEIPWQSLNSGGGLNMSSTFHKVSGSLSQSGIGEGTSTNHKASLGFWYGACVAKPGDADADNTHTLADVIAIVNYIFKKAGWPACPVNDYTCWLRALTCRGDWNAIDGVTLADVIRAVNYIFKKTGWPFCPANNYTCWLPPATGACCLPVP